MEAYTVRQDYTSSVSAHRLFTALFPERHVVIPKVLPEDFKSMEILEGDGGVGTIKRADFTEAISYRYMVHRIEVLDMENCYGKYTLFEGDVLKKNHLLDSIAYEIKFEATSDGSKGYMLSHYYPEAGTQVNKDMVEGAKGRAMNLFKKVEEYLLANPHVYA